MAIATKKKSPSRNGLQPKQKLSWSDLTPFFASFALSAIAIAMIALMVAGGVAIAKATEVPLPVIVNSNVGVVAKEQALGAQREKANQEEVARNLEALRQTALLQHQLDRNKR